MGGGGAERDVPRLVSTLFFCMLLLGLCGVGIVHQEVTSRRSKTRKNQNNGLLPFVPRLMGAIYLFPFFLRHGQHFLDRRSEAGGNTRELQGPSPG